MYYCLQNNYPIFVPIEYVLIIMNTNKSILYQLAKYQTPKEEEPKIDVPDKDPIYEFQPILDKLWSECPIRKTIEEKKIFEKKMLKLLTIPPKSKLYPDITYIRYHLSIYDK